MTLIVLSPLSDATTPTSVRSRGRALLFSVAVLVSGIVPAGRTQTPASWLLLGLFLLLVELPPPEHGLHPRDVLAGLAELAGVLQLLGDGLGAQVEEVLLEVLELLLDRAGFLFVDLFDLHRVLTQHSAL